MLLYSHSAQQILNFMNLKRKLKIYLKTFINFTDVTFIHSYQLTTIINSLIENNCDFIHN
jgi:hypothetical protein